MTVIRSDGVGPTFFFNTSDLISGDHFAGSLSWLGASCYNVDTNLWYVIGAGGLLEDYTMPISLSGSSTVIGKVGIDQTTPGVTNGVQLLASEAHVGQTTGSTTVVSVTPVISASAIYAINDCVGPKMEFTNAARVSATPVTLQSVVITDLAMQNAALNIFLFAGNPATGTYTDNAECDIDDTDLVQCIGVLSTGDGQWISAKDNSVFIMQNIGLILVPTITSIWAVVKTTGTPTYASASDLTIKLGFYRE
jgi:hypothetical protein